MLKIAITTKRINIIYHLINNGINPHVSNNELLKNSLYWKDPAFDDFIFNHIIEKSDYKE